MIQYTFYIFPRFLIFSFFWIFGFTVLSLFAQIRTNQSNNVTHSISQYFLMLLIFSHFPILPSLTRVRTIILFFFPICFEFEQKFLAFLRNLSFFPQTPPLFSLEFERWTWFHFLTKPHGVSRWRFISVERFLMVIRHFSRAVTKERARASLSPGFSFARCV